MAASCDEGVISTFDQGLGLEDWLTLAALHEGVITLHYSITLKISSKTISKKSHAKHAPLSPCFMYKEIAMMNTGILSMNFYFFYFETMVINAHMMMLI